MSNQRRNVLWWTIILLGVLSFAVATCTTERILYPVYCKSQIEYGHYDIINDDELHWVVDSIRLIECNDEEFEGVVVVP